MLEKIKQVLQMFFGKRDINRLFSVESAVPPEMEAVLEQWCTLYSRQQTGRLNLPSAIAGELARLVLIEFKTEVTGSKRADFIQQSYSGFVKGLRPKLEQGLGKGGLIFKPYLTESGFGVDCIPPEDFMPVAIDSEGRITGAVFAQRLTKGRDYYTRYEYHRLDGESYTVENKACKSFSPHDMGVEIPLSSVPEWEGISAKTVIANVKAPLFTYFKVPYGNTIFPSSPLGVSVYARAVKLIEDAENQYEDILWEYKSGRRKVYVDRSALIKDHDTGKLKVEDDIFATLDVADENFFKEWSPQFRNEALQSGLNSILQRIEFNCGLAYGTLSDPQNVDKTAEEVRSSKQRSYAQVRELQNSLETALRQLICAMDTLAGLYSLVPAGKLELAFEFDDSIVADRQTEYEEKLRLVEMGILQPWEMRAWYLGEDEEAAKEMVSFGADD